VSGIACTSASFPRLCLVIDDESQHAQVIVLKDGEIRAGDTISLIDDRYEDEPLELDGEGVAFTERSFYILATKARDSIRSRMPQRSRRASKPAVSSFAFGSILPR